MFVISIPDAIVTVAYILTGSMDWAKEHCARYGIVCEDEAKVLSAADSLEFWEVDTLKTHPGFRECINDLINEGGGVFSDMLFDWIESKNLQSYPWVAADMLLEHLRRSAGWMNQKEACLSVEEQTGMAMSRNAAEFTVYFSKNVHNVRVKTQGKYLYPPLFVMMFVYDILNKDTETESREERTRLYYDVRNVHYLRETGHLEVSDIARILGAKRHQVYIAAAKARLHFIRASNGRLFLSRDNVERMRAPTAEVVAQEKHNEAMVAFIKAQGLEAAFEAFLAEQ